MKQSLILLLSVLLVVNLLTTCEQKSGCCTIIDVDVQVHYQTLTGENLLNSEIAFNQSKIKIYYKNGADFDYVYQGNLDHPNMHYVSEDGNENLLLTVFPSNYYEGNQSTTLIELNENITDTLVCEFELSGSSEICKRAWLNGVEFDNRFIEVAH